MHNQNESPLFRLPPEVRKKIYEYAFEGATFQLRNFTHKKNDRGYIDPRLDEARMDVRTPLALTQSVARSGARPLA
jgi:hypothetical protein